MISFADLPGPVRMALRETAERQGAQVAGYVSGNLQLAIARGKLGATISAMEAVGMIAVEGSLFLFPLGSDDPPASLRHDGDYPGSRGFWLYYSFQPSSSVSPIVVLASGRIVAHTRAANGSQDAIPTTGPEGLSGEEWTDYAKQIVARSRCGTPKLTLGSLSHD